MAFTPWAFLPLLVGLGYIWPTAIVLTAAFIAVVILSKVCGYWSSHYPFVGMREGEDATIESETIATSKS